MGYATSRSFSIDILKVTQKILDGQNNRRRTGPEGEKKGPMSANSKTPEEQRSSLTWAYDNPQSGFGCSLVEWLESTEAIKVDNSPGRVDEAHMRIQADSV